MRVGDDNLMSNGAGGRLDDIPIIQYVVDSMTVPTVSTDDLIIIFVIGVRGEECGTKRVIRGQSTEGRDDFDVTLETGVHSVT